MINTQTIHIKRQLQSVVSQLKSTDLSPVLTKSSALFRVAIDKNFASRGRWDGVGTDIFSGGSSRWKPLANSTKSKYKKKGYELIATLRRTNALKSTIEVRPYGKSSVVISANSPYAEIHQFGGVINHPGGTPYIPVNGLVRFISKKKAEGKHYPVTKPHKITMPARPFLTITEQELNKMIDLISSLVL